MSSASANTDRPMKRQLEESRRERIFSSTRRVFVKDSLVAAGNVLGLYNSKKKGVGGSSSIATLSPPRSRTWPLKNISLMDRMLPSLSVLTDGGRRRHTPIKTHLPHPLPHRQLVCEGIHPYHVCGAGTAGSPVIQSEARKEPRLLP